MSSERALPSSWAWTQFGEVAEIQSNLVEAGQHQDAAHIAPNHIESGTGVLLPYTTIRADKVFSPKHAFRSGHIIYSKIRPYMAKAVLVDFDGLCSADMYPVAAKVDARYLHRWLISPEFTEIVSENQGRTLLPKVNQDALVKLPVPVPPLPEQRRIVSKIESLTARSRRAKEALDAIPTLLERFRQSVLASAFRGDLTAAWRAKNPHVEPADVLLKRIRIERRKRWEEAELAKMRAKGKAPGDDRWKAKYEEPAPVDTSELPELPDGWAWVAFDEIVIDSLYGPRFGAEDYSENGIPTVRTTDIDSIGNIRWNSPPRLSINAEQLDALGLRDGDLVVTRTGATIGKCAIYDEAIGPALPSAYLIRFRLLQEAIIPRYVLQFLLSPSGQSQLTGASTATAQPNVNARAIGRFLVPIAPRNEQQTILERVHQAIQRYHVIADIGNAGRQSLSDLNRSILSKAFRGELVPQDPNDEPASVLLERIRAEATQNGPAKPKRGRGAKNATAR